MPSKWQRVAFQVSAKKVSAPITPTLEHAPPPHPEAEGIMASPDVGPNSPPNLISTHFLAQSSMIAPSCLMVPFPLPQRYGQGSRPDLMTQLQSQIYKVAVHVGDILFRPPRPISTTLSQRRKNRCAHRSLHH